MDDNVSVLAGSDLDSNESDGCVVICSNYPAGQVCGYVIHGEYLIREWY